MTIATNTTYRALPRTVIAAAVLATTIGAVAIPASAGNYRNQSSYDNSTVDYARVIDVKPLVETYQISNPVERCWDERVPVRDTAYDRGYRNKSKTPEILGAIIGGVIGNQVGKRGGGKARDVATVAGAVLGGSVGRDVKHKNNRRHRDYDDRYERVRYETVQRCEVKESYVTKEEVVGYDVSYKYRGNVFHTQMDQHPGDKIKVKVTVDPV